MNYTEKEKEYFNNKLSQVIYNPNRFKVLIGEDRFLFGIVSAGDSEAPFGRLMQYKTLYDTLIDLDWKIKFSFIKIYPNSKKSGCYIKNTKYKDCRRFHACGILQFVQKTQKIYWKKSGKRV